MANGWGISKEVEELVKERDTRCVYCGVEFADSKISRKSKATWEHIINDINLKLEDNVALCCASCNASKGAKELNEWLKSSYCLMKGISEKSVAIVVQNVIKKRA